MRSLTPITWVASAVAIYHLAVLSEVPAFMGFFLPNEMHLAISISCALLFIFLLRRAGIAHDAASEDVAAGTKHVPWYDVLLIVSVLVGTGYVLAYFEEYRDYGTYGELDTLGVVVTLCLALPLHPMLSGL